MVHQGALFFVCSRDVFGAPRDISGINYWAENDDMREGLLDRGPDEQVQNAAKNGDVNELGRLRELGRQWTAQTCAGAAENGHLECLTSSIRTRQSHSVD